MTDEIDALKSQTEPNRKTGRETAAGNSYLTNTHTRAHAHNEPMVKESVSDMFP